MVIERDLTGTAALRAAFADEGPGFSTAAGHLVTTGHGRWWTDRRSTPRTVLLNVGDNWLLRGDPSAVTPAELRGLVRGVVDAPAGFEPVLRRSSRRFAAWDRVLFALDGPVVPPPPVAADVRRLRAADAGAVATLSAPLSWIASTWGGAAGLAGSGHAWGAFTGTRLAAVACTFFRGFRHEELGVVTARSARRQGLGTACAAGLCGDVQARGRRPTWSTSRGNVASRGVAVKLGFRHVRDGVLYAVDLDIPGD